MTGKVDRLLDLVSTEREADVRRMVVSAEGSGERSLFVSYISEVPVWKATYRIVLNAKGQDHLLQGWAIVDNTTGQDWRNIQLSLVAGAPQSFIQNLSQPYYSRRPVVPLPESVLSSPQTFESTLVPGSVKLSGTINDPSGAVVPRQRCEQSQTARAWVKPERTPLAGMNFNPCPMVPSSCRLKRRASSALSSTAWSLSPGEIPNRTPLFTLARRRKL